MIIVINIFIITLLGEKPSFVNWHPKILIKLTVWRLGKNNLASFGCVEVYGI